MQAATQYAVHSGPLREPCSQTPNSEPNKPISNPVEVKLIPPQPVPRRDWMRMMDIVPPSPNVSSATHQLFSSLFSNPHPYVIFSPEAQTQSRITNK